jgi:hypothetical protein
MGNRKICKVSFCAMRMGESRGFALVDGFARAWFDPILVSRYTEFARQQRRVRD